MGDAKMTAEGRVDKVELCADECNSSSWVVLRRDAIEVAEAHAAAVVAEYQARVAELEALLRESQDLFMEAGPFHALRPAIKAQWRRHARAHINALASALAPQAPPARKEGETP